MPRVAAMSSMSQAGELAELDHFGRDRILGNQSIEGLVKRRANHRPGPGQPDRPDRLDVDFRLAFDATLRRAASTKIRRIASAAAAKKVTAAIPELDLFALDQAQIGFVNKCGCLKRMAGRFLPQPLHGPVDGVRHRPAVTTVQADSGRPCSIADKTRVTSVMSPPSPAR